MHRIFSNFAYILLLGMSGMGLLMGKIRPFSMELLPFLPLKKWFLACYSFTVYDVISLSISVLLLFRHFISHKINFGAPSSGGVLCSACGAFISPYKRKLW